MWSERAPEHMLLSKLFPRLCALATCLWSGAEVKQTLPFTEFHKQLISEHLPRLRKVFDFGKLR